MKAKEYFEEVRRAAQKREECANLLSELATGDMLRGVSYDGIGGGGGDSDMGDLVIRGMDRREVLEERIKTYSAVMDEALAILYGNGQWRGLAKEYSINPADMTCAHYVQLRSWRSIAREYGCSQSWCRKQVKGLLDYIDCRAPFLTA